MKSISQLLVGLLAAVGSSIIVLAALSLALAEGGTGILAQTAPTSTATAIIVLTPAGDVTLQPTATKVLVTPTQAKSSCQTPSQWVPYTIQAGDDLDTIASQVGVSADQIIKANCLPSSVLLPDKILYLPSPLPTSTPELLLPTATACGRPDGWVAYTVRSGDTLFGLGLELHVSMQELQQANCLTGTNLRTGMLLYVPFIPQRQAVPTITATPVTPTSTPHLAQPTATLNSKPQPTETTAPTLTPAPPTETPTAPPVSTETPTVPPENTPTSAEPAQPTATGLPIKPPVK